MEKFKWVTVGAKDIAFLLGYKSDRYVYELVEKGIIPKRKRGIYFPPEVVQALIAYKDSRIAELQKRDTFASEIEVEQEKQKLIILTEKASRIQSQTISIEDWKLVLSDILNALRSAALPLPDKLAAEVPGSPDQKKIIREKAQAFVDHFLTNLARIPIALPHRSAGDGSTLSVDIAGDIPDSAPTTKIHRRTVGKRKKVFRAKQRRKVQHGPNPIRQEADGGVHQSAPEPDHSNESIPNGVH